MQYQEKIIDISSITIPRHVICSDPRQIDIHGFCDASEAAYGACIYLRSVSGTGEISVRLPCAKSKVAPLKRVTLPRLELCGALLLTKLGQTVLQALSLKIDTIYYWCDSTIALAWIKHSPADLQTFVANRVAEIQQTAPNAHWSHVKSQNNPADIISRGATPSVLKTLRIWWDGPSWLAKEFQEWPNVPVTDPDCIPELKRQTIAAPIIEQFSDLQLFTKFSSLSKLKRVIAYRLRFKARVRPSNIQQMMGDLPGTRVTPARAFLNSGLDYAGPFSIKLSRNKTGKAYLCVFVCFSTKAVHLEVVSDLSTNAFLNSLKRFIARRGRCATLSSDNGSNFVGASNELKAFTDMLKEEHDKIDKFLADQAIQWKFIPPYSPHMGGLWEAAVKSAKTHLKKIIGNSLLTFEEFSTIFAQIEAILNSRPLCPISDNPQDEAVLTPGHFIIGEPFNSFSEPDLTDVVVNRLTRFQLLSQMRQHFWTRWSRDYLTQLQNRYMWQRPNYDDIKVGALVLLKDDGAPPLKWRMARITELHIGNDNHVRVVSLNTANGTTKRTIHKICVLPIDALTRPKVNHCVNC